MEVLVALTIVAMAVTVYFQLMSAGMKLQYKAEEKVEYAVQAEQLFQRLQGQDVREDEFMWQGKEGQCPWELQIRPVDVQGPEWEEDQIQLTKTTELYVFILTYACPDASPITLRRMSVVDPDFFSPQFKGEHIEEQ